MRYRRAWTKGGTFFFTINLNNRRQTLLIDHVDRLRDAFKTVRRRHPFRIDTIVVLPDHLHAIWTLPEVDSDFSTRWALIKAAFSRAIPKDDAVSRSRLAKGERGIWQRRFWEHQIRDDKDMHRHVDYIHWNPVKHGYVERPVDWLFSSFHRYVKRDLLPEDWGVTPEFGDKGFGEREK